MPAVSSPCHLASLHSARVRRCMPLTRSDLHPMRREKEREQGRHSAAPQPWSDQVLDGVGRTGADGGRSLAARGGRGGKGRGPLGDPPQMREPNLQPWLGSRLGSGLAACPPAHRVQAASGGPRRRLGGIRWGLADCAATQGRRKRERERGGGQRSVAPPMTAPGTSTASTMEARPLETIGEGRKRAIGQSSSIARAGLALASVWVWRRARRLAGPEPQVAAPINAGVASGWVRPTEGGRPCHRPRGDGDGQGGRSRGRRRRKEEGVAAGGSRHWAGRRRPT